MMKTLWKDNKISLILLSLLLLIGFVILLSTNKFLLHIDINTIVNRFVAVDLFFKYITYLGDGTFVILVSLLLLLYNLRLGIALLLSYAMSSLISSALKHLVFDQVHRPSFIFQWEIPYPLRTVEGVDLFIHNSLPSGHATAAFSFFMVLSFFLTKTWQKCLCLVLAALAAFSRVYLSQHFLIDITTGTFIGTFVAMAVAYIFFYRNGNGILSHWNRSLMWKQN
jgi:membrane-associated phospholipid phosphatase